jgi:hypothetical protein
MSILLVVNCGFTVVETTRDELFAEDLKGYETFIKDRERDVVKEIYIVTKNPTTKLMERKVIGQATLSYNESEFYMFVEPGRFNELPELETDAAPRVFEATTTTWKIQEIRAFVSPDPIPMADGLMPATAKFPFKKIFSSPVASHLMTFFLFSDVGITWLPEDADRLNLNVVVFFRLIGTDGKKVVVADGWVGDATDSTFAVGTAINGSSFKHEVKPIAHTKNVSKMEDTETSKAKIEILPVYVPAHRANGTPVELTYLNERGVVQSVRNEAKPLVAVYSEETPYSDYTIPGVSGTEIVTECAKDVWASVSFDEGETWKRFNLSRSSDRSSFETEQGEEAGVFYGDTHKPNIKVQGNQILVAWTSKYARGGRPTYAIEEGEEGYTEDIWGVGGPQRSRYYLEDGYNIELPYSAVWVARGYVSPDGEVHWSKAERLTSGRRDANQITIASSSEGFALVWQEDPEGLMPGEAAGPGEGWSGATTNHKTDIWYSYIKKGEFEADDPEFEPSNEDPEYLTNETANGDGEGRFKALHQMSLPVRLSDNDTLNTENMKIHELTNYPDDGEEFEEAYFHHHLDDPEDDDYDQFWRIYVADIEAYMNPDVGLTVTPRIDVQISSDLLMADGLVLTEEPAEDPPVEETPTEEPPTEQPPVEEPPVEESPTEESIVEEPSADEPPVEEPPAEEPIVEEPSADEPPVEEPPAEEPPADPEVPSTNGEPTTSEETVVSSVLIESTPTFKTVKVEEPVEVILDPPVVEPPAEELPTEEPPVEEPPAEDLPTEEPPVEEVPSEEPSAEIPEDPTADLDETALLPELAVDPLLETMVLESSTIFANPEDIDGNGDGEGSHAYGYKLDQFIREDENGDEYILFYKKINNQDAIKYVVIATDHRLMDGDTGASRPNLMMQGKWAILGYEETKGIGAGVPSEHYLEEYIGDENEQDGEGTDKYYADLGKNVIYHSADFLKLEKVSAGTILNPQETDENGLVFLKDADGNPIYDYRGDPIPAYENARRPRFLVQSKDNAYKLGSSGTVMVVLYKMGEDGKGRPSDIIMQRFIAPYLQTGNPYQIKNLQPGIQNISSITPTEWDEYTNDSDEVRQKMIRWSQSPENLNDRTSAYENDDARAHRGFLRGDFLAIAYTWTPNWTAARNGNDKYDLYIRRSFTGGQTWTTDPNGNGVTHTDIFRKSKVETVADGFDYDDDDNEGGFYAVSSFYGAGEFEPAQNVSRLRNNKTSVIEPRLVGVPGTILTNEVAKYPEDIQNPNAFWVTYGTEENVDTNTNDDYDDDEGIGEPLDLYYSYSMNKGETYYTERKIINPDSEGYFAGQEVEVWDWLAKDRGDWQPAQAEAQIRMTPDGSIFYAIWNESGIDPENGEQKSDAIFRRMMRNHGVIEVRNK